MALRLSYWILFFHLLFLMCGHGNGARDVAKQDSKQVELPDATSHETTPGTKESDYITAYKTTEDAKKSSYVAQGEGGYAASYSTKQDAKDSYRTSYGTKEASKNSEMEHKKHWNLANEVEEANQKRTNKMEQPYIAGYNRDRQANYKDAEDNYIIAYNRRDAKDSHITKYGTKEASKNSGMEHKKHDGVEDVAYDLKQEEVANQKEMDQPYIAGYNKNKKEQKKEPNYIAAYGDGEDSKETVMIHEDHMATKPLSHMDHLAALKTGYFTMDDLVEGNIMPIHFPIQKISQFLPREEADSIPFSIPQLPNLLQLFSIPIDSPNARAMEDTLLNCEAAPMNRGDQALCYLIREIYAPKWVACHPLPYPYKVFFCHFVEKSKIFKVSLGGEDGHKVEAVAVCHLDTSDWNPDHIIFRQLGVKPGLSPICHFLPIHNLVWVPSPTTASI
uniref:BURP domain-containing protein n=1 Tax=Fagus sylvatica TaxID=28930 RepID=A0A2N9IFH8_FAGSY